MRKRCPVIVNKPSWLLLPLFIVGLALTTLSAQAHLMSEQKGTLNFTSNGAFLALSTSASAFTGVDDNKDGAFSTGEMTRHSGKIKQQISQRIQMLDASGESLLLRGVVIAPTHTNSTEPGLHKQITILGRFVVTDSSFPVGLRVDLQGKSVETKNIVIVATRNGTSQKMIFTVNDNHHLLFPVAATDTRD